MFNLWAIQRKGIVVSWRSRRAIWTLGIRQSACTCQAVF
jgi:hypothetical protein